VTLAHSVTDETNTTSTGVYDGKKLDELADSGDSDFNLILYNKIKTELEKQYVTLPPSSAMAGIYARVDSNRGVWKAPANVSISGAVEPTIKITHEAQQDLNIHTSGKSINAIRSFTGKGILVWGARTLAGNDNEWKYVPVRRFFNMVEESVEKASAQFVFEPNDANTWVKVRAMIENFLTLQWRSGALAGAKPEQAFYVRIGLGQTMTADDILNGIMNIEIGMAAVRPAEFIVLKFSHKMQEA
jgi:phage tail sheath protein FI